MDEGEEARGELVEVHGYTAKLLELEDEGPHKMAFLVQPLMDRPGVGDIRHRWDTVIRAVVGDELSKRTYLTELYWFCKTNGVFPCFLRSLCFWKYTLKSSFGEKRTHWDGGVARGDFCTPNLVK